MKINEGPFSILPDETGSKYEQMCREINEGPFSILSEAAKDKIKLMMMVVAKDSYDRGFEFGSKARRMTTATKAAAAPKPRF